MVQVTLESTFDKPAAIMAPASNSTKTLQQNRPRPTIPKAIIPAIPLPYIQKRRQQQAVREKITEEVVQVPQTAVVDAPTTLTPLTAEIAPSVVNGSSDSHATENIEEVSEPVEVEAATTPVFEEDVVGKSANGEQEESVEETMGEQDCFTSIDRSISNIL